VETIREDAQYQQEDVRTGVPFPQVHDHQTPQSEHQQRGLYIQI
jgi:hypothetical protein